MVPRLYKIKRTKLLTVSHQFTVGSTKTNPTFYDKTLFSRSCRLLNFLPEPCFTVNIDVQNIKCNINLYLLFSGFVFFYCIRFLIIFFIRSHSETLCLLEALLS